MATIPTTKETRTKLELAEARRDAIMSYAVPMEESKPQFSLALESRTFIKPVRSIAAAPRCSPDEPAKFSFFARGCYCKDHCSPELFRGASKGNKPSRSRLRNFATAADGSGSIYEGLDNHGH
ncbi:MAG: hypothetical protein JO307_17365 [Bryobacterales bacterium]|nr:hypothetical protein [Bryobacterales bacterium]